MSFGMMKMINDKEFRQKCREFSYQQMEDYFKDYQERDAFKSKEGIAIALLYIAANMSSSNERAKKPCTLCNNTKPNITASHYFYIDGAKKMLVDVCYGEKTWFSIKYCPMYGRKL